MKIAKKLLMLGLITSFGGIPYALADMHEGHKDKDHDKKQEMEAKTQVSKKNRQVSGTIISHKSVNFFSDKKQEQEALKGEKSVVDKSKKSLVVLVKTDKGNERLPMDLGNLEKIPEIKDGETKIKAEGRIVRLGNKELFLAKKVKINDKTIEIDRS